MKTQLLPHHHLLILFPASLLKDRQRRRQIASHLPSHGYLLVSELDNPKQTLLVRNLGRHLQERGIDVSVVLL